MGPSQPAIQVARNFRRSALLKGFLVLDMEERRVGWLKKRAGLDGNLGRNSSL